MSDAQSEPPRGERPRLPQHPRAAAIPIDVWLAELDRSRARTSTLRRGHLADVAPSDEGVALHELVLTYEELSVAEEELRVQHDELEQSHAVVEEERRRYQQLFHHAPVAYVVTDAHGAIVDANRSATRLLEYRETTLIGKPLIVFTHDASRRRMREVLNRVHGGETVVTFRMKVARRTKGSVIVEATVAASHNRRGELTELRWLLVDVRRRRKVERARRLRAERLELVVAERTAELEHAQQLKDRLLAIVSHELRTPLSAIGGYTELLSMGLRGPLSDEQQLDVQRIRRAYEHLARIVDDLLNFNKLVARTLSYDIVDVALEDAVRGAWELTAPQARDHALTLELGAAPPVIVRADGERLRQIIVNLIGNAVKFTGAGGTVRVSASADSRCAMIRVEDNGPGIPEAARESIFEPFVRIGTDHGVPGSGLGLAISRDMAVAMGGELTVSSELGIGSCFTLRIPVSTRFATEELLSDE
jgi:PAS domain S-box-containing protein